MSDNLPRMDYRQHRRARRLVHECCNYDEGNCLLLTTGSCPQPSCTGEAGNDAQSAGRFSFPNPIGGNTALTALPKYAAARKPSDSANATIFLRI